MNAQDLIANLKATNNGYLFAPTNAELATARLHPELFTVSFQGTISPKGFVFERYSVTPAPRISHARDDFDYEGAIMARQRIEY